VDGSLSRVLPTLTLAYINSDRTKTNGADLETSHAAPMSRFVDRWNGNISLRLLATYVKDLTWHRLPSISGVDSCQPECPDPNIRDTVGLLQPARRGKDRCYNLLWQSPWQIHGLPRTRT
jgi:hypothetical protein